jgi:hypothetical protein
LPFEIGITLTAGDEIGHDLAHLLTRSQSPDQQTGGRQPEKPGLEPRGTRKLREDLRAHARDIR